MRLAFAIILLFCARFAVAAWFDPGRDGDIAWQQWLGSEILRTGHIPTSLGPEAFSAPGAPWVPQEWALSIAVAFVIGTPLYAVLAGIIVACGALAMAFAGWTARKLGASTVATGTCVAFAGFSMVESYGVRAQVLAWPLVAALVYLLRCASPRLQWLAVPLVALWANLHASAMLAPVILGVWTLGMAMEQHGWNVRVRHYAALTGASALAIFLTPLGLKLPLYAVQLFVSPIRTTINEWQPSDITADSFLYGVLPLLLILAFTGIGRARRWRETGLFAAVAFLMFGALRNIPVFAIVIAPLAAVRLTAYLPSRLRLNELFKERAICALLYAGAAAGAVAIVVGLAARPSFAAGTLPHRAIAAAALQPGTHNLYCEDFAWCSLALRYPNMREFIDGRCDPFPKRVWDQYAAVYRLQQGRWKHVLDGNHIDAVLADSRRPLAQELALQKGWRLVYSDTKFRLFMRADSGSTAYQHR